MYASVCELLSATTCAGFRDLEQRDTGLHGAILSSTTCLSRNNSRRIRGSNDGIDRRSVSYRELEQWVQVGTGIH